MLVVNSLDLSREILVLGSDDAVINRVFVVFIVNFPLFKAVGVSTVSSQ